MKSMLPYLLLCVVFISSWAQVEEAVPTDLFLVTVGGKDGYINRAGKMVIQPQFRGGGPFSEGLARVFVDGGMGYIDTTGKLVIRAEQASIWNFSEGMVRMCRRDQVGENLPAPVRGYMDRAGRVVIEPRFSYAGPFSQGLAAVGLGGKWQWVGGVVYGPVGSDIHWDGTELQGATYGFIDRKGDFVIGPKLEKASDFSEGVAAVKTGGKWGYIDRTGVMVIAPQFGEVGNFHEGLAPAKSGRLWGFIDKQGKFVIQPNYLRAEDFSEGLSRVGRHGRYGYVDKTGRLVIPPRFGRAGDFKEGLAAVGMDVALDEKSAGEDPPRKSGEVTINLSVPASKHYGYIDRTGKYVIQPQFEYASDFRGGMAEVRVGGADGYIDHTGHYVWKPTK